MRPSQRNYELVKNGKRVFRARPMATNAFWEGVAESPADAVKKAAEATGQCGSFELKEMNQNGNWIKVKWEVSA